MPYCCDLLAAVWFVSAPRSISIPPRVLYIGVHYYTPRFPLNTDFVLREPLRIYAYDFGYGLRYGVARDAENCSSFVSSEYFHMRVPRLLSSIGPADVLKTGTTILVEIILAWDNFFRSFWIKPWLCENTRAHCDCVDGRIGPLCSLPWLLQERVRVSTVA